MDTYTGGFDGSAIPNPGKMKIGGYIDDPSGNRIFKFSREIGDGTNNIAEYAALLTLVKEARRRGIKKISIKGDSQLIVNQVTGIWKAKDYRMRNYKSRVLHVLESMEEWELIHVVRKYNKQADDLTRF
jgi:ribonuclease HI